VSENLDTQKNHLSDEDDKFWQKFLRIYLVLALLFLVMFTMRATVTILQVFVPDISSTFTMEEGDLAIIFTIYNITAAVVSLFSGPISERIGYKTMVYAGMFIYAIAIAITAFAPAEHFWVLALGQSFAGIGAAFFGPSNIAYASDYFPKERSSTAIGIIMSSFYVATIVAVPINAYVAQLLNWRWGVGIMAILALLVAILILLLVPRLKSRKTKQPFELNNTTNENKIEDEKSKTYINRITTVLKDKFAVGTFFITLFQRGGLFAMTTLLSTWILNEFSRDKVTSGLILMGAGIAAITSNSFFSWLADKKHAKRLVILLGTGLTGVWIGIFPLISVNFGMAVFGFVLLNFFGGISMGSYNAFVAEVSPNAKGTAVSINNTFGQFSQAIAVAIIARVIYKQFENYSYCGYAAMGFLLISFVLMIFFVKPKKEPIQNPIEITS
jgi:predicted MFS family arabinose efflux permease